MSISQVASIFHRSKVYKRALSNTRVLGVTNGRVLWVHGIIDHTIRH